jgi:hypothetical protein
LSSIAIKIIAAGAGDSSDDTSALRQHTNTIKDAVSDVDIS